MKSVQCSICTWQGYVYNYADWNAWGHKYPQVWICDECKEW